jgi:hypothetical protein
MLYLSSRIHRKAEEHSTSLFQARRAAVPRNLKGSASGRKKDQAHLGSFKSLQNDSSGSLILCGEIFISGCKYVTLSLAEAYFSP